MASYPAASTARGATRRSGFTLLELVVVLAVLGGLAAVLVPAVMDRLRTGEQAALTGDLDALRSALISFRGDVGRYPIDMRELVVPPTGASRDICNRNIPSFAAARWRGPYLSREIPAGGLPSGPSVIRVTLRRVPATFSAAGTAFIDVDRVELAVANAIERSIDGDADFAAGTIRWAASGEVLSYAMPVANC